MVAQDMPREIPRGSRRAPRLANGAPRGPQDGPGQLASKCFVKGLPRNASHGCSGEIPRGSRRPPRLAHRAPRAPRRPRTARQQLASEWRAGRGLFETRTQHLAPRHHGTTLRSV
eukprot:6711866-Pyramimonas_sp.AAC.1